MSERNNNPEPHPLVRALGSTGNEVEDVIALVGFVGDVGSDGNRRLFADEHLQRYMDIPADDFIHAEALPDDELGRMRVYVRREQWAAQPAFSDGALDALDAEVNGARMSTWAFLPDDRVVAARMLGLLPDDEWCRYEETGP